MARRKETSEQLRTRILDAMRRDIGISEQMAEPFVESIMRCFAGERPYFPAEQRAPDVVRIQRELEAGGSPDRVCERHGLSRRSLFRLFPGGLPRSAG